MFFKKQQALKDKNLNSNYSSNRINYWKTILKYKIFIFLFCFVTTFSMTVYQFFNNPVPIYTGSLMVEIGEKYIQGCDNLSYDEVNKTIVQNETFYFSTPQSLKVILEKLYPEINVKVPYGSFNIIEISTSNTNKIQITNDLLSAYNFILEKHKKQATLYKKYIMTKQVGAIIIDENAKNKPNKLLKIIITAISSLLFSIYTVMFIKYYLIVIKPKLFT